MGCDIHLHFEIKLNGSWEHYDHPRLKRNYDLFAKIAGVRSYGDITPISNPKGLPDDISTITRFESDYFGSDGHSHTWLNPEEISQLVDWTKKQGAHKNFGFEHEQLGYLFGNGWGNFEKYREDYPKEIEEIRLICWFDN